MNVNRTAAKDAARWAYAQMFFGEGAGTRRKLLTAEINHKCIEFPGYAEAFDRAYVKQNFANLAIKAAKERKHLDRSKFIKRNVLGIVSGNRRNLTAGVAIGIIAWGVAKETGADEDIKREVKKQYNKGKSYVNMKYKMYKAKHS
jgi:hypothetical protein